MRLLALVALAAVAAVPAADAATPKPKVTRIATVAEPEAGNFSIVTFTLSSKAKQKLAAPKLVVIGKVPGNTAVYSALAPVKGKRNTYLGTAVVFHTAGTSSRTLAVRSGGPVPIGASSTNTWALSGRMTWGNLLGSELAMMPTCESLDPLEVFARLLAGKPLPGTPRETVRDALDIACGMPPADGFAFTNGFGGFYCEITMDRFGGGGIEGIYKTRCSRTFSVFGVYTPEPITARLDPSGFNCTITNREGGTSNYLWCRGGMADSVTGNLRWGSKLPAEGEFYAGNSESEAEQRAFKIKIRF